MLSVVVVGRNDNHGYNLGKRVACSLNSISMRLREGDELIFVDWNTPNPFPPMPVSIVDDLTELTKKYLRILVVDPKLHDGVKGKSSKMILEPIARNVGIRRANQQCSWILSTNTDILFIGQEELSFQQLIGQLDKRLWQSFRYEIPEYIWEVLDKRNPKAVNEIIGKLSEAIPIKLNLTTSPIEKNHENFLFADAIGDFQLAPREMWENIRGFPEEMLDGWHVDSRAAIQMIRKSGQESKIVPPDFGLSTFHQNHLRSLTHFHTNDTMNRIELIGKPYENKNTWGLNQFEIYEYSFQDHFDYFKKHKEMKFTLSNGPRYSHLQSLNRENFYNVDLSMVFLLDELNYLKPNDKVAIISANNNLISKVKSLAETLGIIIEAVDIRKESGRISKALENADLVILDFGADESTRDRQKCVADAGAVAFGLPLFAEMIKPNTRVCLIRSQNWAIRTLARKYFAVPLFNNYSAILPGVKRPVQLKIGFMEKLVLLNSIRYDYGLPAKMPFLERLIFGTIRDYLPHQLRNYIKRIVLK